MSHSLLKICRRSLVSLALLGAAGSQATPVTGPHAPGYIGVLDNSIALLVGAHPNNLVPFLDFFTFDVGGPSGLLGLTINVQDLNPPLAAGDGAVLTGLLLYDDAAVPNLLAADVIPEANGSFSILAFLSSGGRYSLGVAGVGGNGAGIYVGLLASNLVSEPGTLPLGLASLGLAAMVLRRRKG